MTDPARAVLDEALGLPEPQRAEIAAQLLASLDQGVADDPAEIRRAWAEEIERRAQRVLREGPSGDLWEDVEARVRAQLRQP